MQKINFVLVFCYFFLSLSTASAFDVWFADTRCGLEIDQLGSNSQWKTSTLDAFIQTHNPNIPLVIVTHGYKMTYPEAKQFGINFSKLTRKLGEHRFLFWSWDSEKEVCGIKSDAINAGKKADSEAKHLTDFLKQLKPESKIALIGFSYGARLISNSLHELATEQQAQNNTNNKNNSIVTPTKIRVIFLAAAVDCDQFGQNKKYGNLLSITDKLLVNINSSDPALLLYPLLTGIGSPKAVGRRGINYSGIPKDLAVKIKYLDVRPEIGVDHTFVSSFYAFLSHRQEFRKYALFNDDNKNKR
ncbi:MAG: alpha/beta hydrolase [Planctomycetaceae bacterium]|jgi:esterase/lipase superfamily enzyme|nr:alpha/beta hydrolase [Planctomycetaceae bacterium]